jgi:hypothetical protein
MVDLTFPAALLLATATPAQDAGLPDVIYPALAAAAPDGKGFVPHGWRLEDKESGDLDGDGIGDLALLMQMQDPANILDNRVGMCGQTLDTNPRILAVALGMRGGGYRLVVQNHRLIPRRDNACAADVFEEGGIEIARGALHIDLSHFMSAGGWSAGTSRFHFRWSGNALRLIGFDYTNVQRNTGALSTLSINYLTRGVKIEHGNISADRQNVRWTRLGPGPLLTVDQIGDGTAFDPEGLVSGV